jgi:hypothetical protein
MQSFRDQAVLKESLWQAIESHLEQEKRRIFDEILNYPPPIPACDVQFNFLLAERSKIAQELRRVREVFESGTNEPDRIKLLREFVKTCKYFAEALEAELLADLEKVVG